MTMLRDYSPQYTSLIAHDVYENTDDLEPVDPSVFFGTDEDDDVDEDDDGLFEDDEDVPETEEGGEY